MVKISISEVRKFIGAAKPIKDTKILPIYAYIKLECEAGEGVFYKSNGSSFVVCHVEADMIAKKEAFIIEEKALFGLATFSSGKMISISKEGDSIVLNDGSKTVSCKTHPLNHFPAIQPKENVESFVFNEDVLGSLFMAKSHALVPADASMKAPACYVHMKEVSKSFYISAWNGQIIYLKKFKEKMPSISLDPETISVISGLRLVSYSRCGNYDYFDGGTISYGFIKPECTIPDISMMVNNFKHQEFFTVDRKPILDFCEMVLNVNNSYIPPEISISSNGECVYLKFQDFSEEQKKSEDKLSFTGKGSLSEPFYFLPRNMITVLKNLGCDKLNISSNQHNLLISSDEEEGYIGSVTELMKK